MNLEDRFYSESEVRGVPSQDIENERVYSSFEVQEITDLFSEFYSENGDHYENVDDAYSEFIDAYAVQKFEDITAEVSKEDSKPRSRVGKAITRTGAAALGAGVGYLIALGLNKKDAKEVAAIQAKMDKGQARATDIQRMEALTKSISKKKKGGMLLGAGAGLGTSYLAGKRFSDEDVDNYADDWAKTGFRNEGHRSKIKSSNVDNAMTGALVGGAAASLRTLYKLQKSPKGKRKRLRELNAKYQLHKTNKSQKELTKEEKVELKELRKHFLLHHGKRVLIGSLAGGALGYSANGISLAAKARKIPKSTGKRGKIMKESFKFGLGRNNTAQIDTENLFSDNYAAQEDFNEDTYPVLTTAAIIGGGAALGGGIGNVSARIKNRQLKRKIKRLKGKKNLNSFQQARLDKYRAQYNKDLYRRTGKGAIVGGAAAAGGVLAGGTKAILAGAGAAKSAAAAGVGAVKTKAAALAAKLGATGSGIKGAVGAAGGTAGSLWALNRSERRAKKAAKVAAKSHAGLGALAGTAVGAGASYLATKKLRSEIKALKAKPNKSEIDNANLKSLRRKLAVTIGAGTVAGGAAGAGIGSQIKRG